MKYFVLPNNLGIGEVIVVRLIIWLVRVSTVRAKSCPKLETVAMILPTTTSLFIFRITVAMMLHLVHSLQQYARKVSGEYRRRQTTEIPRSARNKDSYDDRHIYLAALCCVQAHGWPRNTKKREPMSRWLLCVRCTTASSGIDDDARTEVVVSYYCEKDTILLYVVRSIWCTRGN